MSPSKELLTDSEILRYNRQISIKAIDFEGQEALKQAKVLIIGMGGLGCATSQYLAVAGVGELTLVDFDTVELSNLQRQVLHQDADIGRAKVHSAKDSLLLANPHIKVHAIHGLLSDDSLLEQVELHDIIVDCTDNLTVRQQLNRLCFKTKTPLVSGAAIRMEGLITVFDYQAESPCYQCFSQLFGEQQLTCVESGILAPVIGVMGSLQAVETIKLICKIGQPLVGRVLMFDAMTLEMRQMKLNKIPNCMICQA